MASHWPALAAVVLTALGISFLVVLTQHHHGHLTMDSTLGGQKFQEEPTQRIGEGLALAMPWYIAQKQHSINQQAFASDWRTVLIQNPFTDTPPRPPRAMSVRQAFSLQRACCPSSVSNLIIWSYN